tara:strand:- start:523 stop:771 length:249 start_codon:yes stop_codon:yes gene_type:complete
MAIARPIYPSASEEYDPRQWNQLIELLRLRDMATPTVPFKTGYAMTNVTKDRVLDANSTTTAELADVLGTLIEDLKDAGYLG